MSTRNELAFPSQPLGQGGQPVAPMADGLTKRELFAAMAMQGLLSNLSAIRHLGFKDHEIEEFACMRADALLKELAK
jgi:hypothetical protein